MKYYQEISILPDPEINSYFLWTKLYTTLHHHFAKLHKACGAQHTQFGVSFPEYVYEEKNGKIFANLGAKLRVFAKTEQALSELNLAQLLSALSDYVHIKSIREVPEDAIPVRFKRYHAKGLQRIEKHQRRIADFLARKSGKTAEECLQNLLASKPNADCNLPYILLNSSSTGHKFQLFIQREEVDKPQDNQSQFSCYGLSSLEYDSSFVYEF